MNKRTGSSKKLKRAQIAGGIALVAGAVAAFASSAQAAPAQSSTAPLDAPPYAVEDFNYPGADRILAERGFELKRGDGHIVVADCTEANVLTVSPRGTDNRDACFRITGDSGWLTLDLPRTFLVHTNDYSSTQLELTADSGAQQTFDVGPDQYQAVGESDPDSGGDEFTLVEIRVAS